MRRKDLARIIDLTLVRPNATETEIRKLCAEAVEHQFYAVAVNPTWTKLCSQLLKNTLVKVDVCVGFPLGATTPKTKISETEEAISNGASEIDFVINIGALKSGYTAFVEREIIAIVKCAVNTPVKVILETSYLTDEEKILVCKMALNSGASFVKTCTGFGLNGATVEDVRLMRLTVGNAIGVKAAGGIRTYADAITLIQAGANRIGTSAGVKIIQEAPE